MSTDYLSREHTPPPRRVRVGNGTLPLSSALDVLSDAELAARDIYAHHTPDEDAYPLGYTDWVEEKAKDGTVSFSRDLKGSATEREVAKAQRKRDRMSIERLQARLALLAQPDPSGVSDTAWDAVQGWAVAQGGEVQAFFEDAMEWRRMDPRLLSGASAFGWDEATLDHLFGVAETL